MNVLLFMTPKSQIKFCDDSMSIRQVLEILEYYRYTTIPLLTKNGKYKGSISEGDLLFYLKNHPFKSIEDFNNVNIGDVQRYKSYLPITSHEDMSNLIITCTNQNFVPIVDDSTNFIGIVTRKSIINYLYLNSNEDE